MRLKITRISIVGDKGKIIESPTDNFIDDDKKAKEEYRKSRKRDDSDVVRFHYEEVED